MPATTPKQSKFPLDDKEDEKVKGNGYAKPTFVRCDLTSDQKKALAKWADESSADDLLNYIDESCTEGYVLSIKPTDDCYQASLTQSRPNAIHVPNGGKSLVTRASTPERVLWAIYYKHKEVMNKDWSKGNAEASVDW